MVSSLFSRKSIVSPLAVLIAASFLAGCSGQSIKRQDGTTSQKPWSVTELAKSDADDIVEMHQQETIETLKRLTIKLYKRNPAELQKNEQHDIDAAVAGIFDPVHHWHLSPRRKLDWLGSINNAFNPDYAGDRVDALMKGLLSMVMLSYGNRTEIYITNSLNPQSMYNAARNMEIAVWRLSNSRDAQGNLLLLTNSIEPDQPANLSFEREFGKLIATQDLAARIVEARSNRAIRFGAVNVASMIFLPI